MDVPQAVDNDLDTTEYSFGFDTAVHIATQAFDRRGPTAESHHRCMSAGRSAGALRRGRGLVWLSLVRGDLADASHVALGIAEGLGQECLDQFGSLLNGVLATP